MLYSFVLIYIAVISLVSAVTTVADKISARRGTWRVPEKTLLLLGALGGAGIMYFTMKLIRHKTRKLKFMLTLPLMFLIHLLLFVAYNLYV